ncbi:MAG: phosphoribosylaminoimidazolesuccinocarboxamide synthase [Bdellovibrionaceae bacterium]|nr:phosphoribosylaminoimidazolesuccinocarboxamide synthase [Pseudobdellovibrionaceae bacterium]
MFEKAELMYEGKAKQIFAVTDNPDLVWMHFKNSLTAFNAEKKDEMDGKGEVNQKIASVIFRFLQSRGVETHFVDQIGDRDMVCQKVEIIPLEVVVRNTIAGSLAKKFGLAEGEDLQDPLTEFFYKKDELGDPFLSDEQALMLGVSDSQEELDEMKQSALKINQQLSEFFGKMNVRLVDFKVEFGRRPDGSILLADEITPDSCRLWDKETGDKLDKDRFRRDLGRVLESYQEIYSRIEAQWQEYL